MNNIEAFPFARRFHDEGVLIACGGISFGINYHHTACKY